MKASSSGLYFQDRHPLITLENIRSISDNYEDYEYPAWEDRTGDVVDQIRSHANSVWICIQTSLIGVEPGTDTNYWIPYTRINEILETITKRAITNTLHRIMTEKKLSRAFKSLLENKALLDGAGRIRDKATNEGAFVGFEITLTKSKNLKSVIHKIGIQLDTPQTVTVYLFHTSRATAIKTKEITVTTANTVTWADVSDWNLKYDDIDTGGAYYLGYFQDAITGQAIIRNADPSIGGCSGCGQRAAMENQIISACMSAVPFKYKPAVGETLGTTMTWEIDDVIATPETNYGLNLVLSVYCDLTKTVIEQAQILAQPIRTQLAIDLLWEFAMNPHARVNRNQNQATQATILYELDGDSQGTKDTGLRKEHREEIKAVAFDLSEIDRLCLPASSPGIRYKTV